MGREGRKRERGGWREEGKEGRVEGGREREREREREGRVEGGRERGEEKLSLLPLQGHKLSTCVQASSYHKPDLPRFWLSTEMV